jgi:nicotinamidase-related amidase
VALSTRIIRPSSWEPFSDEIARSASSVVAISTNPNPRDRPVSRSVMTAAESTAPKRANAARSPSVDVENERPPTNSFTDMTGSFQSVGSTSRVYPGFGGLIGGSTVRSLHVRGRGMPPARNDDLHGNAPDAAEAALLLVDVINDLEFEGGDRLLPQALDMARRLAALAARARRAGIPVIYANDNFGHWRSDFRALLARVLEEDVRGRPVAEILRPEPDDYIVLKPKHSAFYSTTLDLLLRYLHTRTLVLAGLTGDRCVLFTASDAYMRDFRLVVPADGVVSIDRAANRRALEQMRVLFDADVRPSRAVTLRNQLRRRRRAGAA